MREDADNAAFPPSALLGGGDYAAVQQRAAELMRTIREDVTSYNALTRHAETEAEAGRLQERMRSNDSALRTVMQEAQELAARERRLTDLSLLQSHYQMTQQLVRGLHTQPAVWHSSSSGAGAGKGEANVFAVDECDSPREGTHKAGPSKAREEDERYDLCQDEEFMRFFDLTRERDTHIDSALDRIHEGVHRLGENARGIQYELGAQEQLLDEAQAGVTQNQEKASTMNSRLQKVIKALGKSRLVTYVVLLVILIVLIIVIIFLGRSL